MRRPGLLHATVLALFALQGATVRAQPAGDAAAPDARSAPAPDVTLRGVLTGADHETYKEIPFIVPEGVERITVELAYAGREAKTTVDLGLRDPERFRGWSGGNKSRFTLSAEEATPSYLPGVVRPGTWRLILGVPNIRRDSRSTYTARIWFARASDPFAGFAEAPLRREARWYRGDLHSHTAHSDGSCANASGVRAPCPLHRTVEAAVARGLDFIAITEHNATSHYGPMRELQPFYDTVLLIPGREITTFQGHANLFGPTRFVDFQVTSARAPTMAAVIEQAHRAGGLISINHPTAPSGEACMGCGWTAPDTDWTRVDAIEAVNGGSMRAAGGAAETPLSGIPFWEARLNAGFRLTAVGGSDNHDAGLAFDTPSAIGRPTTVIHAPALSQPALLRAIRDGRVFIDLDGTRDRGLDMTARLGGQTAFMGGRLDAPPGSRVAFEVRVANAPGARVEVVDNGRVAPHLRDPVVEGAAAVKTFEVRSDGWRRWVRVNLRAADGRLLLVGNPVYLNFPARPSAEDAAVSGRPSP